MDKTILSQKNDQLYVGKLIVEEHKLACAHVKENKKQSSFQVCNKLKKLSTGCHFIFRLVFPILSGSQILDFCF